MNIEEVKKFAINKHNLPSTSQRYGVDLYDVHLIGVVGVYKEYNYLLNKKDKINVEMACWCHDLIEDTDVNVKIISNITNNVVADIVFRVTNERGYDRKEKNFKTYPKIWENDLSIFVKLCDRIFNTRNSKLKGHRMFDVYKKEYPIFKYALNVRNLYKDMWIELDTLYGYVESN
jgi:(p)ppGpp synthase/HD superfamily hydrolase